MYDIMQDCPLPAKLALSSNLIDGTEDSLGSLFSLCGGVNLDAPFTFSVQLTCDHSLFLVASRLEVDYF